MRNLIWIVPAILFGLQVTAIADTILPGTEIPVRTDRPIELHTWDQGRIYPAHVAREEILSAPFRADRFKSRRQETRSADPGYMREGDHYHHEGDWYR